MQCVQSDLNKIKFMYIFIKILRRVKIIAWVNLKPKHKNLITFKTIYSKMIKSSILMSLTYLFQ